MENQTARRGVDDIAGQLRCPRQILFFLWVSLNERKWVTFGERRSGRVSSLNRMLVARQGWPLIRPGVAQISLAFLVP
jgi:hypothetical protein